MPEMLTLSLQFLIVESYQSMDKILLLIYHTGFDLN